jgi:hypothetical protein
MLLFIRDHLERAKGFEPSTPTLASDLLYCAHISVEFAAVNWVHHVSRLCKLHRNDRGEFYGQTCIGVDAQDCNREVTRGFYRAGRGE